MTPRTEAPIDDGAKGDGAHIVKVVEMSLNGSNPGDAEQQLFEVRILEVKTTSPQRSNDGRSR